MSADPRLLVVDDEPDLRTLYEMTLLREGFSLDSAGTVEDALELLGTRRYDAVITDMRLPDGSGLDILRWLEQQGRSERALVITAYGSAENAVEALKAGAYDYLTKPVDLRQFRMVVASALGRTPKMEGPVPKPFSSAPAAASSTGWSAPSNASSNPAFNPASNAASSAMSVAAEPDAFAPTAPGAFDVLGSVEAPRPAPAEARKPARAVPPLTGSTTALERLVGDSAPMRQVRELIEKVARSMAPVLLNGESGTGKELVARCLHDCGRRREGNFAAINCGGMPEALFESEMFGHEAGAFTGAARRRIGKIEHARGGTLFLDEIETMPMNLQVKMLRALQERQFERLGSNELRPMDSRVVAATKADLLQAAQAQKFRDDLYYRLSVVVLHLPPLRERREDIPLLFTHFAMQAALRHGREQPAVAPRHLQALMAHAWPGNVRELRNIADRFVLGLWDGEEGFRSLAQEPHSLDEQMAQFERYLIREALEACNGSAAAAAERLGVPRKTLYDKMRRLGPLDAAPSDETMPRRALRSA